MIQYLTISDIEKIRNTLNLENAEKPYNYKSGLELTLSYVQDIHDEIDDTKTKIASKAGYLLYQIVTGHYFSGGNKRTGLLTVQVFLNINNYNLEYDEGDGFILVMGIVRGTLDQKIISTWIENHMIGET